MSCFEEIRNESLWDHVLIQNHQKMIYNSRSRSFRNTGPLGNKSYSFVSSKFPIWSESIEPFRRKSKMSPRCSIFQQWKMIHNSGSRIFQNLGPPENESYSFVSSKFPFWTKWLDSFWRKSEMSGFGTTFCSEIIGKWSITPDPDFSETPLGNERYSFVSSKFPIW